MAWRKVNVELAQEIQPTIAAELLRLVGMTAKEFELRRSKLAITSPKEFQQELLVKNEVRVAEQRAECPGCGAELILSDGGEEEFEDD